MVGIWDNISQSDENGSPSCNIFIDTRILEIVTSLFFFTVDLPNVADIAPSRAGRQ